MPTTTIDLLARALVLLLAAWLAAIALRHRSASLRALVWTVALGGLLILPVLSQLTPAWRVAVLPEAATPDPAGLDALSMQHEAVTGTASAPQNQAPGNRVPGEPTVSSSVAPTLGAAASERPFSWGEIALLLWGLGTLLLLTRIVASHVIMMRLSRRSRAPFDGGWTTLVDQTRTGLGIVRPVAIRMSDAVNVPAVVGVLTPVLLLPDDADEWAPDGRRAVVLHELAHVARWDALGQLVGQLACAAYWFVPLVWYGARSASSLRERASDDVVLRAGVRASVYAANLLNLARLAGGAELRPAALAMARPSRIRERVVGILDPAVRREAVTGRLTLTMLMLAGGVITAVAAVEPTSRASVTGTSSVPVAVDMPASSTGVSGFPAGPELGGSIGESATAVDESPVPVQDTTLFCARGLESSSSSINENDNQERTWVVKLSGSGCKVDLRVEGKVEFNEDFTDIKSLSNGGFLRLDVTDRGIRRQLDIRQRNGSLERTWRVDGNERPYDAAARAWFAGFLIELDRRTAVAVDVRLPLLLRQGGADAVLKETALMPSDYARSQYYTKLAAATRLSSAELARLLQQAAALTESDYYSAELLSGIARQGLDDPAVRAAVLGLIEKMESDHYRAQGIESVIGSGRPSSTEMDLLLRVVGGIESDYYKTETMTKLLRGGDLDASQRAAMAQAASGIESDFYAADLLKALAKRGDIEPVERQAFLEAVGNIESDFHVAEVLTVIIQDHTPSASEVEGILRLVRSIESDFYRGEVLGKLLSVAQLTERDLVDIVAETRAIESDFHQSETLQRVVNHRAANDRVRRAVLDAAEGMSGYYRDEVRRVAGGGAGM